jgi:hypothetical protein
MAGLQSGQDAIQAALPSSLSRGTTSVIPYGESAVSVGEVYSSFYASRVLGTQGVYQGLINGFGSLPLLGNAYSGASVSPIRPGKF